MRGFTLIELMVVISILAILVAIGVTSYSTIRKNSRDSIRKADLHSIQNALEQYQGKTGSYPVPSPLPTLVAGGYIPKGEPTDPKNGCSYEISSINSSAYNICAYLESGPNSANFCK